MKPEVKELAEKGASLSPEDREELIKALVISLDSESNCSQKEYDEFWEKELTARVQEVERGEARVLTEEEFLERLEERRRQREQNRQIP